VRPDCEWLLVEALTASRLGHKEGLEGVEVLRLGGLGNKATLQEKQQQKQQQQPSLSAAAVDEQSVQHARQQQQDSVSTSCQATVLQQE
jgi:hypothetical protein